MKLWTYFADSNQALILVPAPPAKKKPAQRYWGKGEWLSRDKFCGDWSEDLDRGYRQINPEEVPEIAAHIDAMPGGVFRDRSRFWEDQAHRWSIELARSRADELDADTGPNSSHWTVQSYFNDVHELERLRVFLS